MCDARLLHIENLKYSQNVKGVPGLWAEDVDEMKTVNGNNSSLARETWREICVSVADIFHMQISAHPRGAFISVGDCNPD